MTAAAKARRGHVVHLTSHACRLADPEAERCLVGHWIIHVGGLAGVGRRFTTDPSAVTCVQCRREYDRRAADDAAWWPSQLADSMAGCCVARGVADPRPLLVQIEDAGQRRAAPLALLGERVVRTIHMVYTFCGPEYLLGHLPADIDPAAIEAVREWCAAEGPRIARAGIELVDLLETLERRARRNMVVIEGGARGSA